MGRLAGFKYREITRKLKVCGFQFDRQAAGDTRDLFNPGTNRYTTIPNHPAICLKGRSKQSCGRPEMKWTLRGPFEGGAYECVRTTTSCTGACARSRIAQKA